MAESTNDKPVLFHVRRISWGAKWMVTEISPSELDKLREVGWGGWTDVYPTELEALLAFLNLQQESAEARMRMIGIDAALASTVRDRIAELGDK